MTLKYVVIGIIMATLLSSGSIAAAFAGGPRLDYDQRYQDVEGAPQCWVDGYDAGFSGQYDGDRAEECNDIPGDQYNRSWEYGCEDATFSPDQCEGFKNTPVDIEDHIAVGQENADNCWNEGYEDGKTDKPFNKDRARGCDEYTPDYEQGYNTGCITTDNTQSACDLLIKGEENYCPWHPDIAACVPFLRNDSNKMPEPRTLGACGVFGDPRPNIICPQESNPEGYCLRVNHTAFCKTIGDLCDEDGFVKPEYPYCINKEIKNVNASSKPEIVPPVITGGTGLGSGSMCPDGYQRTEDGENCRLSVIFMLTFPFRI